MKFRTALMLLQHGPLRVSEFVEITGWKQRDAERVLYDLRWRGLVSCPKRGVYQVNERN